MTERPATYNTQQEQMDTAVRRRNTQWVLASAALEQVRSYDDDPTEHWTKQALCAQTDPEAFFPNKGGTTRPAKKVCEHCPVTDECLEDALALPSSEDTGVKGGLSERDRQKLRKQRQNEGALLRRAS